MFKYFIQLLFVGLLLLNLDLTAQDSTGTVIDPEISKKQETTKPNQSPTQRINPIIPSAEVQEPIIIPAENTRRLNQTPKTTAEIKINQAPTKEESVAAKKNNPFALIRNGEPQKSKPISMFPVSSKKRNPVQEEVEEAEIKQEEVVIEIFEPVDTSTSALNSKNPFRLEGNKADRRQLAKATKIKFNPNAGTGVKNTKEKSTPLFDTSKVDVNESDTLKFTLLTVLLGLLAFIVASFRSELTDAYQAVLSQNLMALLHRDKETIFRFPYLSMYLLTTVSLGTTIFLILNLLNIEVFKSQSVTVMTCISGIGAFFFSKHLLLNILSLLFPFKKEIRLYSFTIALFNFILGIALLPFIALLAFANDSLHDYVLYAMLFLVCIILIYRLFRSLLIGQKYIINNKFHFFMYLCTVEIAPMVILFKFLS